MLVIGIAAVYLVSLYPDFFNDMSWEHGKKCCSSCSIEVSLEGGVTFCSVFQKQELKNYKHL